MYGIDRIVKTSPRASRAYFVQPIIANASAALNSPPPNAPIKLPTITLLSTQRACNLNVISNGHQLFFGSSTSRSLSPNRLNAATVKKMAAPGDNTVQGAVWSIERPLFIIAPHSAVGG